MARGATFAVYRTWVSGNILTASDLTSSYATFITNLDLSGIGSYYTSLAEMRTTADPALGVPANLLVWTHYMHYKLIEIGKARGITLTNWDDDIPGIYAASTGTDTILATFDSALTAHTTGMPLLIKAGGTNTGATTFNPNSVGAKDVKVGASALTAGQIIINKGYWLMYDGTQYQLLNPDVAASSDSVTNISAGTYTVTAAQMTGRVRFYNSIQTAITLPAAAVGLTATFEINHIGGIRFIRNAAPGTDTFTCGGTAGLTALPVGGTTYDIVIGGLYELTCYVAGTWTVKRKGVQPSFSAKPNVGNQAITGGGGDTKIQFNDEINDNNNDYDPTTNYRHTPLIPGKYDYIITIDTVIVATNDITFIAKKKGSTYKYFTDTIPAGHERGKVLSILAENMDSTDYLEAFINSSANTTVYDARSWFMGVRRSD